MVVVVVAVVVVVVVVVGKVGEVVFVMVEPLIIEAVVEGNIIEGEEEQGLQVEKEEERE